MPLAKDKCLLLELHISFFGLKQIVFVLFSFFSFEMSFFFILQLQKGREVEVGDSFQFNEEFTAPHYRSNVSASFMQRNWDILSH